jgi:hypothetical protein
VATNRTRVGAGVRARCGAACGGARLDTEPLSLAGAEGYWLWSVPGGISCCDLTLTYQLFSSLPIAKRAEIVYSFHCGGETLGPLAAGGTVAAFGTRVWTSVVQCDETFHRGGHDTVTGGGVSLIGAAGAPVALVGAPSPAMLAVAQGRVEVVPLDVTAGTLDALPPPLPEIQQWSAADGTLVRTIPESGTIRAMAVTKGVVVVLVDDGSGNLRLDRFSTASGAALGSTAVLASTAPDRSTRPLGRLPDRPHDPPARPHQRAHDRPVHAHLPAGPGRHRPRPGDLVVAADAVQRPHRQRPAARQPRLIRTAPS